MSVGEGEPRRCRDHAAVDRRVTVNRRACGEVDLARAVSRQHYVIRAPKAVLHEHSVAAAALVTDACSNISDYCDALVRCDVEVGAQNAIARMARPLGVVPTDSTVCICGVGLLVDGLVMR